MKIPAKFFLLSLLLVWGCGQKSHDQEAHDHMGDDSVESTGNDALYDQVMKVHDEVMPKMNDIYKLKEELKGKIDNTAGLAEEKKKEVESAILKLDSASQSMMVWMRGFNPVPDSLGEEKAREYLETEMEKVKNVRGKILEALEEGKTIN